MAYDSADVGTLRYLIGHAVLRITEAITSGASDEIHLDAEALWFEALTSIVTDDDAVYAEEYNQTVEALLDKQDIGESTEHDLEVRMAQLRACLRSVSRRGVLTRLETPSKQWVPKKTEVKA